MVEKEKRFREAQYIVGGIAESVVQKIWEAPHGFTELHGFRPEDPTLTGRAEDGDDGLPIVVVRQSDGARFSIDVQIWGEALPPLEQDPDYVDPSKPEAEPVDPNQLELS